MNNVFLIGRLARDPEIKFSPKTGKAMTNFTLAVDRNYVKEDGTKEADFIGCICWGKTAEHVANYLSKGRLTAVSGEIQTSSYEKDGKKNYKTHVLVDKVQFLDWAKDKQQTAPEGFFPVNNNGEVPF